METKEQYRNVLTLNKKIFKMVKLIREKKLEKLNEISNCPPHPLKILFGFIKEIPLYSISLVFRASVDGYSAKSFHSICDGIENLLVIIKANDYFFGNYLFFF